MIKKIVSISLSGIVSLIIAGTCTAQSLTEKNHADPLGEVVVTGESLTGAQAAGTLHEITAEELEVRQVKTLDQALEMLPGLDIRKGAKGIPRVNIRGLRSRHVVLMLNGIPFNSTYDAQFDPAVIPVENIAKIKVSYGTHSVLYGQGGLGGTINIITKKGVEGVGGSLAGEIDDRGDITTQGTFSWANSKISGFVSGSTTDADGYGLSSGFDETSEENGGLRENSDAERRSLFANLGVRPGDHLTLGLCVSSSTGEYGQPASTINDKKDIFAKKPKYERMDEYDNTYAQVSMGYDAGEFLDVRAWAYLNTNEEEKKRYDDDTYTAMTQNKSGTTEGESTIQGLTLQTGFDWKEAGRTVVLLSAEADEYESDSVIMDKKGNPEFSSAKDDLDIYTAGVEHEILLFDMLGLVAGYSHHFQEKDRGKDDDQGSWMAGAYMDVTPATRIRASYARKIRFASIKNLYDPSSGNRDLTTEKSDNYEAGIIQTLPWNMTAQLGIFLCDVEDYIEKDEQTDIYENHDEYRFKGIEVLLTRTFAGQGNITAGYTYLDARDRSDDSLVDQLEYRPRHKLTLEGRYRFDFGLTAYASFMGVMDQYHYSDGKERRELGDYAIVDIKVEQTLFHDTISVYAGADNVFDEDYEESYGFPQEGRVVYAGMKYTF